MTVVYFPRKQRDLFTRRWRKIEKRATELSFHIPLVAMLRWALRPDVLFWHTPNGELRDKRAAAKLKAMGVLPGVADLQFHWCEIDADGRRCRRALHLELKAGNRPQSSAQVGFALAVKLLGDDFEIARSVDEAIATLATRGLLRNDVRLTKRGD